MDQLLTGLRAAAEPTRLRLLALCAQGEMSVSELVQVLGQSQPRISRHLKLLCDAGLLDRLPEGSWVFYCLAAGRDGRQGAELARTIAAMLPADDPQLLRDRERLKEVRASRAEAAAAYFQANADQWDEIRSLHVDEREVEGALMAMLPPGSVSTLLDIGTGTGRMLELFGPHIEHGVGIDSSRAMLSVARSNLAAADRRNCIVRLADLYCLPIESGTFDAVTIHQVLHYAEDPAAAIAEAARMLRPGGRLVIVDFAPHALEYLRADHAHRRLGFSDKEVTVWLEAAGLEPGRTETLLGVPLTVKLWQGVRDVAGARGDREETVRAEVA